MMSGIRIDELIIENETLKEHIAKLEAENKLFRASEDCKDSTWDYVVHEVQKQLDINEELKEELEYVEERLKEAEYV